jgi:hypothetical protein
MDDEDRIYRDLQKHLDRLPTGFQAMESGADIRNHPIVGRGGLNMQYLKV